MATIVRKSFSTSEQSKNEGEQQVNYPTSCSLFGIVRIIVCVPAGARIFYWPIPAAVCTAGKFPPHFQRENLSTEFSISQSRNISYQIAAAKEEFLTSRNEQGIDTFLKLKNDLTAKLER